MSKIMNKILDIQSLVRAAKPSTAAAEAKLCSVISDEFKSEHQHLYIPETHKLGAQVLSCTALSLEKYGFQCLGLSVHDAQGSLLALCIVPVPSTYNRVMCCYPTNFIEDLENSQQPEYFVARLGFANYVWAVFKTPTMTW